MRTDFVIAGTTALLAVAYLISAQSIPTLAIGDPLGPRAFPTLLGIGLLLASALLVVEARQQKKHPPVAAQGQRLSVDRALLATVGAIVVLVLVFEPLGYILSIAAFLLALTTLLQHRRTLMNLAVSIGFAVLSYLLFDKLLGINLPHGILSF